MLLACGIELTPSTTRQDILHDPRISTLIHEAAQKSSLKVYDAATQEKAHNDAFWGAADDYNCTVLELERKVLSSLADCAVRRAQNDTERRIREAFMALVFEQEQRILDAEYDFDDDVDLVVPGNPPHYAAGCTDCHHPNPGSCAVCHVWDA